MGNAWRHFCTITYHKLLVMRECFRLALYRQGVPHDLSKYSWTEFRIGAKYYQGTRSPNNAEREAIGYSSAWPVSYTHLDVYKRQEQILVITFTKAAAKEMRERFARITKDDRFPVTFGTFHGIYYGILKWAYRMNASNIFSEEEKMMLLREVIAGMELEIEDEKEDVYKRQR